MSKRIQAPEQVGQNKVTVALAAHQEHPGRVLERHLARSATQLGRATRKTSNAIGAVGEFVKGHAPARAAGPVDSVVGRTRRYIDGGRA